jgi:chorismate mutase
MNARDETVPETIDALRAEIDRVDEKLLQLVTARIGLGRRMAAAKAAAGETGFGYRPARELALVRALVAQAGDGAPPPALSVIWRALMAANLAQQGPFKVVATPDAAPAARAAFGAGAQPQVMTAGLALAHAAGDDFCLAILPFPRHDGHDWWPLLGDPRYTDLRVVAAAPIVRPADGLPDVLVLSTRAPEAAGEDHSLLILEGAAPRAALALRGLHTTLAAEDGPLQLVLADGYVAQDDPRLSAGPGLDAARACGAFAFA